MIKPISNFMAWLGGADKAILTRVPQERARFVQMAGVLLTTASIAVISMIFAIHNGVKAPLAAAIIVGLFWGFIILNLDRFLVLSMGSTRDIRRLVWLAVPRVLLAIVISLVISTPLTLRIFASDINVQLAKMQASESKQLAGQVADSGPAQEANQLLNKINADKAILDGHLPETITEPQLQTAEAQVAQLQPKVATAQQAVISAREAWQCELYGVGPGCAGASNQPGNGPIAQAKEAQYQAALNTYNTLNGELQTALGNENAGEAALKQQQGAALSRYQNQAHAELPGLQKEYATLEASLQTTKNNDQNAINANTGLLAQLSALWAAGSNNFGLLLAQLTVMALFFLIEMLPVTVKFLLNMGPLTTYETVAKLEDEKVVDTARLDRITQRRNAERESDETRKVEDGKSKMRINVEEDMRTHEEALGKHANQYVAGKMQEILDLSLQEWSNRVRAKLSGAQPTQNGSLPGAAVGFPTSGSPSGNGSSPPPQTQVNPGLGLPPDVGQL
jgi:hypothetical protein